MIGVRPCPCGGEVEVVKLNKKPGWKQDKYRISCKRCGKTVACGLKFDEETDAEGKQRIEDYEKFIANKLGRVNTSNLYKNNNHKPSTKDLLISGGEW